MSLFQTLDALQMREDRDLGTGHLPGFSRCGPSVIRRVLINEGQVGQSERRGCDCRSRGQVGMRKGFVTQENM